MGVPDVADVAGLGLLFPPMLRDTICLAEHLTGRVRFKADSEGAALHAGWGLGKTPTVT